MEKPKSLSPDLYDKNYYLHSLPGLEHIQNEEILDPAAIETVRFGQMKPGGRILDFGCGRGALAITLAKKGWMVVGVDFSKSAIEFARDLLKRFPDDIKNRVRFEQMEMADLSYDSEFDTIIFNQVYEHLHPWELEILIPKFKRALKPNGMLVISTPNLDYIRYLFPLKRMANLPFKIVKEILRVFRGKSRHTASFGIFLKEIFKIRYPESEHTRLHINLQTPAGIRRALEQQGFQAQAECVDSHADLLSLVAKRWWGETIWLTGTVKNQTAQAQL
ncbi:MAG: methyltransferase domain-containing protein [Candidatus Omnitrophica bacterium]|nr:methyltransferase domain-containing protein [Candidatus Omnitrophota bacterium]